MTSAFLRGLRRMAVLLPQQNTQSKNIGNKNQK